MFDGQDSGNLCIDVKDVGRRGFVKFAYAPTDYYTDTIESTVERLKAAVSAYCDLAHPTLIKYPADFQKFKQIPLKFRIQIFESSSLSFELL